MVSSATTLESWEIPSSDADDDDSEWEEAFSKLSVEKSDSDEGSSKPIDIQMKGLPHTQRYLSHEQVMLSSKSLKGRGIWKSFQPKKDVEPQPSLAVCLCEGQIHVQVQRKRSKSI